MTRINHDNRNHPPKQNADKCTCNTAELYHAGAHEYECALVRCDSNCGALQNPETIEEYRAALVHWRSHGYLSGCAHANS